HRRRGGGGDRRGGPGRRAGLRPGPGPAAGRAGRRGARSPGPVARPGRAPGQRRLRAGAAKLMASGPRRPGFYLGVLITGFIAGGFLTAFLGRWLPESAAKSFFTTTASPTFGPVSVD